MAIEPELLKILACPFCVTRPQQGKGTLATGELEPQGSPDQPDGLKCKDCGRIYKIENGLPNFLIDEAIVPKR
jgi:uncharacterized protein YbaR (Trm112 family)